MIALTLIAWSFAQRRDLTGRKYVVRLRNRAHELPIARQHVRLFRQM